MLVLDFHTPARISDIPLSADWLTVDSSCSGVSTLQGPVMIKGVADVEFSENGKSCFIPGFMPEKPLGSIQSFIS